MGVVQSYSADILVITPHRSSLCGDPVFDPNVPHQLQGLITQEEWHTTIRELHVMTADIMCYGRMTLLFVPGLFIFVIILTTAASVYAAFLFLLMPLLFFWLMRINVWAQQKVTRVYDDLNARIYHGALLYPEYSRRRRRRGEPIYEIKIHLGRLRSVRADSLPSAFNGAPPATNPAAGGAMIYVQAPAAGFAAATVSPIYTQPVAATTAEYGGYAVAQAVPVDSTPQVASVIQQPPAVVQIVVPQGCTPGSVLNATLSDGRVIAVTVPENVKAGQTLQVQVPLA